MLRRTQGSAATSKGSGTFVAAGGASAGGATSIHRRTLTVAAAGRSMFRELTNTRQGNADNLVGYGLIPICEAPVMGQTPCICRQQDMGAR